MKLIGTILAGATLALAPAALAQTAPAPAPQPAPQAQAPASAATVTEAEVGQFATAALEIDKIRKDTATPEAEKGTKMAAAATAAGLTAERFNAIGQAMQADTALNQRIQAAASVKLAAAGGAPAAKQP